MSALNIEKTIEELRWVFTLKPWACFFIDVHPFKVKTHVRNLQTIKKKYEEAQKTIEKQKLKIDILEAEKLTMQAEKKTVEVRLEEINLKLKLKTAEYESMLAQGQGSAQLVITDYPKNISVKVRKCPFCLTRN